MVGEGDGSAQRKRGMVTAAVLCAAVICSVLLRREPTVSVAWSTAPRSPEMLAIGGEAPEFALPGVGGVEVSLAGLHGGETALAFVTVGCPYCKKLYGRLDSLIDPPSREIVVICRGTMSDANDVAQSHAFPFPVLADSSGTTHGDYLISGVPAVYLVDERGLVSDARSGWPAVWELLAP